MNKLKQIFAFVFSKKNRNRFTWTFFFFLYPFILIGYVLSTVFTFINAYVAYAFQLMKDYVDEGL